MAGRKLSLYGKKVTLEDILEEIHRLLYAKGNRPYPLRPPEIAKALGISRDTVYNYIKKLAKRDGALKGKTPSEEALIKVDGKNRWKTIIENASLYKENSI